MYPVGLANQACGLEFEYRLTAIGTRLARGVGIAVHLCLGADLAEISQGNCSLVASVRVDGHWHGHLRIPFPARCRRLHRSRSGKYLRDGWRLGPVSAGGTIPV